MKLMNLTYCLDKKVSFEGHILLLQVSRQFLRNSFRKMAKTAICRNVYSVIWVIAGMLSVTPMDDFWTCTSCSSSLETYSENNSSLWPLGDFFEKWPFSRKSIKRFSTVLLAL